MSLKSKSVWVHYPHAVLVEKKHQKPNLNFGVIFKNG